MHACQYCSNVLMGWHHRLRAGVILSKNLDASPRVNIQGLQDLPRVLAAGPPADDHLQPFERSLRAGGVGRIAHEGELHLFQMELLGGVQVRFGHDPTSNEFTIRHVGTQRCCGW